MCKAVDATVAKFGALSPEDKEALNMRPLPKFEKSEIVSANTPVEVTSIRSRNNAFMADWARVHNPGALPVDGAQDEWLRDQWFKEKKKKAAAKAKLSTLIPASQLQTEKAAMDRIAKENAAWLKTEQGKEQAELVKAQNLKDKGRKEKDLDEDLLKALLKNFSDPKEGYYGMKHGGLAGFIDKDPIMKGLFKHLKTPTRDPQVAFLKKALKIPAAGTAAAEKVAIEKIRVTNEKWLKSMGAEFGTGGSKPQKREDIMAMAKKGFPEYEKPNAMGTSGGQLKVAPTNSSASKSAAFTRQASANALWPPPSAALKKVEDAELARIHKENVAYDKKYGYAVGGTFTDHYYRVVVDEQPGYLDNYY